MEEEEINLNKVFNNDDDLKHYYHANLLEGTQCRCSKGSERGGSTLLSSKEVILVTKSQSTFQRYPPSKHVLGERRACGPEVMGPSLPRQTPQVPVPTTAARLVGAEQQTKQTY